MTGSVRVGRDDRYGGRVAVYHQRNESKGGYFERFDWQPVKRFMEWLTCSCLLLPPHPPPQSPTHPHTFCFLFFVFYMALEGNIRTDNSQVVVSGNGDVQKVYLYSLQTRRDAAGCNGDCLTD